MPTVEDEDAVLGQLSSRSMARLAGVTTQSLRNFCREGLIEQVARGKYDAEKVLAALRTRDSDRMTPLKTAQLSLRQQQARRQQLDNDAREGRLVPVEDVHEFAHLYAGYFVRAMESIRKGLGSIIDGAQRKKVDKQFRGAREDLAHKLEAFRRDLAGNRPPEA